MVVSYGLLYHRDFVFISGENYTSANQAVGQVNCSDSTSNNIFITGIQMEIGHAGYLSSHQMSG